MIFPPAGSLAPATALGLWIPRSRWIRRGQEIRCRTWEEGAEGAAGEERLPVFM